MAFAFVATAELNSSSSSSGVCNKPTGTVDDDIMFALVMHETEYSNSVPSGWTSLGQNTTGALGLVELFWKKAASEGTSWTWGFATANKLRVLVVTYRDGFDLTTPIDVTSNTAYTTSNTTCRAASMSVAAANSPIIYFGALKRTVATTYTPPTTPTTLNEDYDGGSTLPDFFNEIASVVWSGSGATGDIDATMSVSLTTKHAFAVALKPASGAASNSNFLLFM